MALALYMDHNVPGAITNALRIRGIDLITAYEDQAHMLDDAALLDRATALQRVMFTRDDDFLVEAARRQQEGDPFYGVIFAHQLRVPIGICVSNLEMIAKAGEPDDVINTVLYLPL
jgi:hypothetical protein